jgi:hypothetical protein
MEFFKFPGDPPPPHAYQPKNKAAKTLAYQPKNKAAKTPLRQICRFLIAKVLRVEERSEKTYLDTAGGGGIF